MESLINEHRILIKDTDLKFKRSLLGVLPWNERLMGIQGFRGVGKTTMILQYIKENYGLSEKALYISLDNIYFSDHSLKHFATRFVAKGGEHLFIDEVHKYPNWAVELKNIYDLYRNLKVTFTASSLLEIINSSADLSRRALVFPMQGFSYREFLNFTFNQELPSYTINDILEHHKEIALEILGEIKPLQHFGTYLSSGYYPFSKENKKFYLKKIQSISNMVIEMELPLLRHVDPIKTIKLKQLLYIIAHSVPFKPNISKLASRIGITRNTLVEYIKHLADANLLNMVYADKLGLSVLQKPDMIYLENTNLSYAFASLRTDIGNLRESFFLNQLLQNHSVTYPKKGDFLIDDTYLFEVGGRNKDFTQIAEIENSYIAADDIEYGFGNKIPLWLFGFLY